jgi:putative transcriptional regulator
MGQSYKGQLIVARPELLDDNFDRTITVILDHSDDGALGLVLNRPTTEPLGDYFAGWVDLAPEPQVLYEGGPVEREGLIALAKGHLTGDLGLGLHTIDLEDDPALAAAEFTQLRVFAGHAGWGPGQLEVEMANGAWWTLEATAEDVFSTDPGSLWSTVLRRADTELQWFAHYPKDPSLN